MGLAPSGQEWDGNEGRGRATPSPPGPGLGPSPAVQGWNQSRNTTLLLGVAFKTPQQNRAAFSGYL